MKYELLSYEEEMARLEEIYNLLSSGNQTLDSTVTLYEEATERLSHCRTLLAEAELRITKIAVSLEGEISSESTGKD